MNQQERLEKKYDDNADCFSINGYDIIGMDKQTFIRVASELLEEREKGKNEPIKDCGCRCADDCSYTSEERKTEKPDYCRIVNGKHNL